MRKWISVAIIAILVVTMLPYNAKAITLGEYEAVVQKYVDELKANQEAVNKTDEEIRQTNAEIANISTEIQNISNEIEKLNNEIVEYNEEIKEKSLQTKEIFEYFQMANGENAYLEYAFGAESITDLIYRMAVVEQMTEYNNKVTDELERMIEANKQREKEIEQKKVELNAKSKEMQEKLVTLGHKKTDLTLGATTIQQQIDTYQKRVDTYRKLGCKSSDVIGVDCATYGDAGIFRKPIPYGYVTSEIGYRWGSLHRGLDMSNGDPYNTRVYPIANGKIKDIFVDLNGAKIVVIEHYDAVNNKYYSSVYGHLNSFSPNIYYDKFVTSDEYIGYMGNSGYSFGAHLHLEVAPCRYGTDAVCIDFGAFINYFNSLYNQGKFRGARDLINFPAVGVPWYSR